MTKYTRRETIEAEQWNKPGDLPGIVRLYDRPPRLDDPIERNGTFEVISDAEFKAQGWKVKS